MNDFFIRALSHPRDYVTMFNKRTLILTQTIKESENIYSFIFTSTKLFSWKAGQHGVFYFADRKIEGKTWRPFSVASAPGENIIRIATIIKENPSDFKKNLLSLQPGDTLKMNGPFGEFHASPNVKQIVGIAGGIGITPFRSLITDIKTGGDTHTKLTLIYSAIDIYTFKTEFDAILPHPQIEIIYTVTPEEVNTNLDRLVAQYKNNAYYFISGSPGMIGAIRNTLKIKGTKNIVNDPFKGY